MGRLLSITIVAAVVVAMVECTPGDDAGQSARIGASTVFLDAGSGKIFLDAPPDAGSGKIFLDAPMEAGSGFMDAGSGIFLDAGSGIFLDAGSGIFLDAGSGIFLDAGVMPDAPTPTVDAPTLADAAGPSRDASGSSTPPPPSNGYLDTSFYACRAAGPAGASPIALAVLAIIWRRRRGSSSAR